MRWATSRLVVFSPRRGTGLRFQRVGRLVISQFCVRDTEASGGRAAGLAGEFPVKPEGADVARIQVARAMRHASVVRDGHKVFRACAAGSAKSEGVFTDRSLVFQPNVL